ncbi:MAG TPA: bifunctional riboflavin kinase/FMN adenylyltransferase [Bacteroidales bacterium]|nr:bifunctional riboflavin kinase/FMN adenylyltransferase [Bacteroidales bacterium]
MRIFHSFDELTHIPNPVVTTGSFDGVHVGHKAIINRINRLAMESGGESVLITFHPHPRKVLFPETAGKDLFLINSQREKIELLTKAGLNNLIVVEFTRAFSEISSIDFIRNLLVNKLHARKIVIGFNHQFGHNREGNFEYLNELGKYYGFDVEEIPEQDIHNETVSSTLIRKALQDGRIQRANAYLDHHYMIIGKAVKGSRLLHNLDLQTYFVTIDEECKLIPPDGVYAVRAESAGHSAKAIVNIRNNRYGSDRDFTALSLEVFPFEQPHINELEVKLFFAKKIRDELIFSDTDDLKRQLVKDRELVEELIF